MKKAKASTNPIINDSVFKVLFENSFDAIILYDTEGKIKYTSSSIKKISGFSSLEVIGKLGTDFIHPDDRKAAKKAFYLLVSGNKKKVTLTQRFIHKNGTYYWGEYTLTNLLKHPLVKGIVSNFRDITVAEKTRQRLENLNSNLQGVLESTNESIYAINKKFEYISFNSRHKRIMNELYNARISVGSSKAKALKGYQDESWVIGDLKRALRGNQYNTERFIDYPKYRNRYISTSYNPIRDNNKKVIGVAVFVRDVTDYKRAEAELKKANSFLESILESTTDRIIVVDRKCNYMMFNNAHQRDINFSSRKKIKLGGNFIDALPSAAGIKAKKDLNKVFRGQSFFSEFVFSDDFTVDVSYSPVYEGKKIIGASLFVRNSTTRKRNEVRIQNLNEELLFQNNQLASQEEELRATLDDLSERNFELDQLMYKTSHDLRAPLSSILGLVNLANMDENPDNSRLYISKIEGRINKLDEFIRSMLNYAKVSRGDVFFETIDIVSILNDCIKQLEFLENFKTVQTKIPASVNKLNFKSDPILLNIILSNIISNAYKYTNDKVKSFLKIDAKLKGKRLILQIEDNGIGIREEYMVKIFDMFYRATERSQGSGLGLYIVKQAVEKLNGNISITSIFGKGTKIKITLPITV